jgi:hypothetical protein
LIELEKHPEKYPEKRFEDIVPKANKEFYTQDVI